MGTSTNAPMMHPGASRSNGDGAHAPRPNGGKSSAEPRLVMAVVSLAILTFLGILSETSLNIAYATLMGEFAIGADVVQWLTTGYLLLLSVAIPASPFMVRRFPTRGLFAAAVAIFTVGTLIGALASSFPMLLAARLVMALGTGISLPLITNIILEKAPLDQRGAMLGIVSLVTCAAPAIGPVFGGVVMEWLDWHWIFYTMLPFLAISFAMGLASVPEIRHGAGAAAVRGAGVRGAAVRNGTTAGRDRAGSVTAADDKATAAKGRTAASGTAAPTATAPEDLPTISIPSLMLVAAGLSGLIVAVSCFAQWNGDCRFWTVLAAAVAVLAVFVVAQLRMARPLVEVRVFAYPGFSLGMLILLMASGGVLGLNFMLPILLQRGFGFGSLVAALILLPGAVVGAIAAPLIGGALKSHFPPRFILAGFAVVTVMDVALIAVAHMVWAVAIAYAVFMAFSGFVLVPDQTHALNQLPARLNADGSAVMNTVQQLAGAVGTAVASTLITEFTAAAAAGGADGAAATVVGFSRSMVVVAGMGVVGAVLALLMFRFSTRRPPELNPVEA